MMDKSIWNAYCQIYSEFGRGPVSAGDVVARTDLSEPMVRKVIWELKSRDILEKAGREGREVKFCLISPIEGGARIALSSPNVRYRYVVEFLGEIQGANCYIAGTTALNYYAPCHAPVLELGCERPSELEKATERHPYVRTRVTRRVPSEWEDAELEGVRLRIASVEDAVLSSYADYPNAVMDLPTLDYMTAIALRVKGKALRVKRFGVLPTPARRHLKRILGELDLTRDLRRSFPRDVIEEEAKRTISADASTNARRLVETLTLMGAAVWLKS